MTAPRWLRRSPSRGPPAPPRPAAGAPARAGPPVLQPESRNAEPRRWRGAGSRSRHRRGAVRAASLTWYVQRMDEALTEQVRSAMPYAATLGIVMLAASKEEVHAAVEWEERLTTAAGILHGGVLMGLADTAGAYCAYLNLPEAPPRRRRSSRRRTSSQPSVQDGSRHVRGRSTAAAARSSSRPTSSTRAASTSPESPRRRPCCDAPARPAARSSPRAGAAEMARRRR